MYYKNKYGYHISIDEWCYESYFNERSSMRMFYKEDMPINRLIKQDTKDTKHWPYSDKESSIFQIGTFFRNLLIKGLTSDSWIDYNESKDDNFFFTKELCQSILEKGITHPIGVYVIDPNMTFDNKYMIPTKVGKESWDKFLLKFEHTLEGCKSFLHPGSHKILFAYFLGMDTVPVLIQHDKNNKIDLKDCIEVTEMGDLQRLILDTPKEDIKVENAMYSDESNEGELHIKMNRFFGYDYPYGVRGMDITSPGGCYVMNTWLKEYPVKYCKILKNSFPLNVYIGNYSTDKEYDNCVKNINSIFENLIDGNLKNYKKEEWENIRNDTKKEWGTKRDTVYPYESLYVPISDIKLNFIKFRHKNSFDIPKLNDYKGFCIYTDCDVKWERDILELFYFTHTEKAYSAMNNPDYQDKRKVIIFNTEHIAWKYTNEPNYQEQCGLLPEHYEK